MKGIFLFCTKLWVYLSELPLIILFMVAIKQNKNVDTPLKLYPLMTVLVLGMIFIFLYYFRVVKINFEEIRMLGLFSGRDRAIIKKDRTLSFTLWPGKKMIVELSGRDEAPALDWIDPEDYLGMSVNLFRAKAVGGEKTLKHCLMYFEVPTSDMESIFSDSDITFDYESLKLTATTVNEHRCVSLDFKESI